MEALNPTYLTIGSDLQNPAVLGNCLFTQLCQNTKEETKSSTTTLSSVNYYYNSKCGHAHISREKQQSRSDLTQEQIKFINSALRQSLFFQHSPSCPARQLQEYAQTVTSPSKKMELKSQRRVKLAACMTVFDSLGRILLTKRNPKMKLFPGAWVFPGGHLQPGESLADAAIREFQQETGINVKRKEVVEEVKKVPKYQELYFEDDNLQDGGQYVFEQTSDIKLKPYFLFQSLSRGKPKEGSEFKLAIPRSHHLVIFYMAQLPQKFQNIKFNMDMKEVAASAWFSLEDADRIMRKQQGKCPGIELKQNQNGQIQEVGSQFDFKQLHPIFPNDRLEGIARAHSSAINALLINLKSKL